MWLVWLPMDTSLYTDDQFRLSGASYTVLSGKGGSVSLVTTSNVSESVELMDSGAGQSVLTRDVQKVVEAEAFGREGHTENATYNKKAKLTPAHQCENPEPPILAACRYNQVAWLQELLEKDPTLACGPVVGSMRDESWVNPLCVAAREGHEKAVEQLLKALDRLSATARPAAVQRLLNTTDSDGLTPLQLANQQNHHKIAVLLQDALYKGAVMSLHRAAKEGDIECLKQLLLTAPVTVFNEKSNGGWTPLCLAAANGHTEFVCALLSISDTLVNEKNNYGWTPLCFAAYNGHTGCIRALLSISGIRVNEKSNDGWTPLFLAVRYGHLECARVLLGVTNILDNEKNNDGWTPLCVAARYGHVKCVKVLLSTPGILVNEKNSRGHRALLVAAHFGQAGCVRVLLTAPGILVNGQDDPMMPLHCAAREGHAECVRMLLNAPGILVNIKDYNGLTPLQCAARNSRKACLKLLIASSEISTTLLNAVRDGQTQILAEIIAPLNTLEEPGKSEVLMRALNVADQDDKTLLFRAVQFGHEKVVAVLLTALKGLAEDNRSEASLAVLGAADRLGRTPLYIAAALGHDKIVTQLLAALHGLAKPIRQWAIPALVNAADLFGKTSLLQAHSFGHFQIESLLTRAFPDAVYEQRATQGGHTTVVSFNDALLRLKTLPKTARVNAVMAVLHHAREGVLLQLDVVDVESYHPLVAEILAALRWLPEAVEDISRNWAILKVMDCLCEDGKSQFSYACVDDEEQVKVANLLQSFPILSAARNGQTAIVARMLKILGSWPESSRSQAVMTVVAVANIDWVTELLEAGQPDQWEIVVHSLNTPGRVSELGKTAPFPVLDKHGVTPLHWAAYKGHHEVVGQLLNAVVKLPATDRLKAFTALVSAADPIGATALYWAAFEGHDNVVEQFLKTVNDFPESERVVVFEAMAGVLDVLRISPLSAAIDNGHKNIVEQLLKTFPLFSAVLRRQSKSVEQFMQALAELPWASRCSVTVATLKQTRADGATPLYIAASQGNIEIIKLLLGATSTLLIDGRHKEVREVLYSARKEEDGSMEISPLSIAARNRHVEVVTLLLAAIRHLFSIA